MEKQWKEEHLLALVDAASKVSKDSKVTNLQAKGIDEYWNQVADKMPDSVFAELNRHGPGTPSAQLPGVCKRKFFELREYFNHVLIKYDLNYCLSRTLMKKMDDHFKAFPADEPFVSKTGPQAKLIKIDPEMEPPADSARADLAIHGSSDIRDISWEPLHLSNLTDQDSLSLNSDGHTPIPQSGVPLVQDPQFSEFIYFSPPPNDQHNSHSSGSGRQNVHAEVDTPLDHSQQGGSMNEEKSQFKDFEFVKKMTPTEALKGLLRIPKRFCTANFSHYKKEEKSVVVFDLIGKDRKTYKVSFLTNNRCLSAGWTDFAKTQGLEVNDIVQFRLVKPETFQVGAALTGSSLSDQACLYVSLQLAFQAKHPGS
ncbi:unnamed protein product [Calypogeia fissa]